MRKWQLISAATVGIMASGSGFIQAQAADYVFFVDFDTKQVSNFNDYTPTFLETTYNLNNTITWTINTEYRMNACPPSIAADPFLQVSYQLNAIGSPVIFINEDLPNMPCTVGNTFYQITGSATVPTVVLNSLVSDDANFVRFRPVFAIRSNAAAPNRIITLTNLDFVITTSYEFDTTYLFNYFLSDSQYTNTVTVNASYTGSPELDFDYVMTTAGNDRYFVINSNTNTYGTIRKKFAIDYNMEYFRGESIGSRYLMKLATVTMDVRPSVGSSSQIYPFYDYYYLNAANNVQPIVDVPEFNFEYEDCGSFLALNVGCFINNGLAYITTDAPIISDAITLLNSGMQMAGQAFGVIGSFTDDNVFGVLVLGGLGLIAVRWFLKND